MILTSRKMELQREKKQNLINLAVCDMARYLHLQNMGAKTAGGPSEAFWSSIF